jgi:hypothetical protein
MERVMRKIAAALVLLALVSSVTNADARGGRTTANDCEPGSADPDCPDDAAAPAKKQAAPSTPAPPPKSGK